MADRSELDPEVEQRVKDILALVGPREPDAGGRRLSRDDSSRGGPIGLWNN